MKTANCAPPRTVGRRLSASAFWLALGLGLTLGPSPGAAQTVRTLAGGHNPLVQPYGHVDGETLTQAKFHNPSSLAVDRDGNLVVADRDNNAIRRLNFATGRTSTILSNLTTLANLVAPVGVAYDRSNVLYVLSQGDGFIRRYDTNLNMLDPPHVNSNAFVNPTAFAIDRNNNVYVAEEAGRVICISPTQSWGTNVVGRITNAGVQLKGLAVMNDGRIALSDAGNHAILLLDPNTRTYTNFTGGRTSSGNPIKYGFSNGLPEVARFYAPHGLAKAPNGVLLVADTLNHRVRRVETNGYVSTFYGIDPALHCRCDSCSPTILPGWSDGAMNFTDPLSLYPAASHPEGLAINFDGTKVYATELGYHNIREITGMDFSTVGPPIPTNVPVAKPIISPVSGYYPNGVTLTVDSLNPDVFYTTDGTEPTTNSLRVNMVGNTGTIRWGDALQDLTALRVKAFVGTSASETVQGSAPAANVIGVTPGLSGEIAAGIGASVIVPVIATLQPDQTIQSLQFNVEITSTNGGGIPEVSMLPVTDNDFCKVKGPSAGGAAVNWYFQTVSLPNGQMMIFFSGGNPDFALTDFAVLALLKITIPIPNNLTHTYQIAVTYPSATTAGNVPVPLSTTAPCTIRMSTNQYLVGDTAPALWYNAGDFGDLTKTNLDNADVNNAFYASVGVRSPFSGTDAYNAMDAYPEDGAGSVGGDGNITIRDWDLILRRSQREPSATNNWYRYWSPNGFFRPTNSGPVGLVTSASDSPAPVWPSEPGTVWFRQAVLGALPASAAPGTVVQVPVYLKAAAGIAVSNLQFRAVVEPVGAAPALTQKLQFVPLGIQPTLTVRPVDLPLNQVGLGYLRLALQSSNRLGILFLNIPGTAQVGDVYVVRFQSVQANDLAERVETFPARITVGAGAPPPPEPISDEWKTAFFGSISNLLAEPNADADGDGISNWQEYLAGTNPTNRLSRLVMLANPDRPANGRSAVRFHWISAPGKTYLMECATNLHPGQWSAVATNYGDGQWQEFTETNALRRAQFYRVRVLAQ